MYAYTLKPNVKLPYTQSESSKSVGNSSSPYFSIYMNKLRQNKVFYSAVRGTGEINASILTWSSVSTNYDADWASLPARTTMHALAPSYVNKQSLVTLNTSLLSQTPIVR